MKIKKKLYPGFENKIKTKCHNNAFISKATTFLVKWKRETDVYKIKKHINTKFQASNFKRNKMIQFDFKINHKFLKVSQTL